MAIPFYGTRPDDGSELDLGPTGPTGSPSGPTGSPSGPTGSPSGATGSAANEEAKKELKAFGLSAGLIALFPNDKNLQDSYKAYLAEDYGLAEELWYKSIFYTTYTGTKRTRAIMEANQKPAWEAELKTFIDSQRRVIIATYGKDAITDEEAFKKLATDAFREGMNEVVFQEKVYSDIIKPAGPEKIKGGSVGEYMASLSTFASSMGMEYNDKFYNEWGISIIQDQATLIDAQNKIRQDAASTYRAFSKDILAGKSLEALASSYKQSMANILQIDYDTISWSDPVLKKALQGETIIPIWQFEIDLRQDPRWAFTDNGRDSIDNKTRRLLSEMGLVM